MPIYGAPHERGYIPSVKPANLSLLKEGLATLELSPEKSAFERLVGYHDFLLEYNQHVNLTGFRDEQESVIKNLLNALAPWRFVDASRATADVGTGGGMPGLPLAIMLGMERMSLVESKQKKCDFLRAACEKFAPTVEVLHEDVNMITRSFGQIISIAYGTLAKLLQATTHMRAPGTRVLAWKGRLQSVESEIAECRKPQRRWKVEPFEVPGLDAERHLCILQV
ncbi:MAG: 16S rRNA (guanine(527)-N(7))-methyltransferase RsmG [Planctomycetes bacterium]|nr:16S rRNA (guanine(527)-N(7))-methyltransferase RsmG [Planctomycetota bacterium]